MPPKDRDIAMVFQNYALYPHMSVYDNMALGLKIRRFSKDEIDKRVKEAASILDIGDLLGRKPKALSGGQRQRVAVGRAIVRHPKVFLFDEPLSNLDAKLRVQTRTEISSLHTRLKATMIYVTHDQVEAMTMADKIVVMKDGLIQQVGSPLDLYECPANVFVAGFIGSPPMNLFTVKVKEQGGRTYIDGGSFQIGVLKEHEELLKTYTGSELFFGIRPESFDYREKPVEGKSFSAVIDVIEPLGNETHLFLTSGKHKIVGRIAPTFSGIVGDEIHVEPRMDKAVFFDISSAAAIEVPASDSRAGV